MGNGAEEIMKECVCSRRGGEGSVKRTWDGWEWFQADVAYPATLVGPLFFEFV